MTEEISRDKIQHLLGHWIEHNQSHNESFEQWAERLKEADFSEVADAILEASEKMEECTSLLEKARDLL
ncbi:rubrerythrin [Methanohalophilus levihalophilus]|uniref:hypothetical protein n=1 Tax=Methanohalophilus levihalophilus TaxID=1431282 RepID=UPI001AE6D251|nr:hypothetical protein [Methanohalophilus levihalophilus]MBP2030303.1 rubrerythrin [Methanohalophilus levihalophilus]